MTTMASVASALAPAEAIQISKVTWVVHDIPITVAAAAAASFFIVPCLEAMNLGATTAAIAFAVAHAQAVVPEPLEYLERR